MTASAAANEIAPITPVNNPYNLGCSRSIFSSNAVNRRQNEVLRFFIVAVYLMAFVLSLSKRVVIDRGRCLIVLYYTR